MMIYIFKTLLFVKTTFGAQGETFGFWLVLYGFMALSVEFNPTYLTVPQIFAFEYFFKYNFFKSFQNYQILKIITGNWHFKRYFTNSCKKQLLMPINLFLHRYSSSSWQPNEVC